MTKHWRIMFLVWAVSVASTIPAMGLEGRTGLKVRPRSFYNCVEILGPRATSGPLSLEREGEPPPAFSSAGAPHRPVQRGAGRAFARRSVVDARGAQPATDGRRVRGSGAGAGPLSSASAADSSATQPPNIQDADKEAEQGQEQEKRDLEQEKRDREQEAKVRDQEAQQREQEAQQRDQEAQEREQEAKVRDQEAQQREQEAQQRKQEAQQREQEARQREQEAHERAQERMERERELYGRGTGDINEGKFQQAIEKFNQVIEERGAHAEGALYWKAYAQNKLGQCADALETLATLRRTYPKSGWLDDAKALEVEVRQSSGQSVSPDAEANEDLKLIAINSLLGTDPAQGLPMLEKFLTGPHSLKLKERALFVLSQSGSPKAREVVGRIASGNRNPELQMMAIRDLGLFGGKESRATLEEIYKSSHDAEVKRAILQSFMMSGERERLFEVAKGEPSAELRAEAVKQLGVMGARTELYQLYQSETSAEIKRNILQAMFVGGDVEHTLEVARGEKDSELRRQAVRNLGLMGKDKTAGALVSIYSSDKDPEVKRAVIQAFFLQSNTTSLIQIARQEKDMSLKKEAVQKLSLMHNKESTDFMMELLNK